MLTHDSTATHAASPAGLRGTCSLATDPREFLARCFRDVKLALALLDEFDASLTSTISEMTLLCVSEDMNEVAEVAHSLKGAASIIGAEDIRAAAAEIEIAGRIGDATRLPHLLQKLRTDADACRSSIAHLREQLYSL